MLKKLKNLPSELSLKRKLFLYMFLPLLFVFIIAESCMLLFGNHQSTSTEFEKNLNIQMDFFVNDLNSQFELLTATGASLSENSTAIIESYLEKQNITFSQINGNAKHINAIEKSMFLELSEELKHLNCSGAFFILDATINPALRGAEDSRAGLYLQKADYIFAQPSFLLYRGNPEIGKANGVMPYRKWTLEFQTDYFPGVEDTLNGEYPDVLSGAQFSPLFTMPATSEDIMLYLFPVQSSQGGIYGVCGFEISKSFFKHSYSCPSSYEHQICLLLPDAANADSYFSAGTVDGYYLEPSGSLDAKDPDMFGPIEDDLNAYVGITREIELSPQTTSQVMVMTLESDFTSLYYKEILFNAFFFFLLSFFAVGCCYILSKQYLSPILKGLSQLKEKDRTPVNIPEIDSIYDFIDQYDEEIAELKKQNTTAQSQIKQLEKEVKNLTPASDDVLQKFQENLATLTTKEREIFHLYLEGLKAVEVSERLGISANTLKTHNRKIYTKLNVKSYKELVYYATQLGSS